MDIKGVYHLTSLAPSTSSSYNPRMSEIQIEETEDETKIILPVRRNWLLVGLFSVSLVIWVVGLVIIVVSMFDEGRTAVLNCMVLIWLALWGFMGKSLWKQWQRYISPREILFLAADRLTLRRPVSMLGSTDAYDRAHLTPFIYDDERNAISFDYANHRVSFGHTLPLADAQQIVEQLNTLYFPDWDEDEEENYQ